MRRLARLIHERRLLRHWPYALLAAVVLPLLWIAGALAARAGLFALTGPVDADQVKIFLTFIGGGLATAATVFTALLTREHNARERWRLRLDSVIKGLEAVPNEARARVSGLLSAMVLLGPLIAIRVLEPAWQAAEVDDGTATWLIGKVLSRQGLEDDDVMGAHREDETAVNEAAVLLLTHADRLTDPEAGVFYFPGPFLTTWSQGATLPEAAKHCVLLSMGTVLASRDRAWWSPREELPLWPSVVLLDCAESDSDPGTRAAAATLLAVLDQAFPGQLAERVSAQRAAAALGQADAVAVPGEVLDVAARIRTAWSPGSAPVAAATPAPAQGPTTLVNLPRTRAR